MKKNSDQLKERIRELEEQIIMNENRSFDRINEFATAIENLQAQYAETIQLHARTVESLNQTSTQLSDALDAVETEKKEVQRIQSELYELESELASIKQQNQHLLAAFSRIQSILEE
jgi:chromosome segregation ATPase